MLVGLLILPACTGPATPTGEAVTVNLLIRTEDERQQLGDYLGDQLEGLGFNVTRQYLTSSELPPIWISDPADGTWNAYTGGWRSTSVSRDEGSNFGFFYTPLGGALPFPCPCPCWPWEAYTPTPEFLDVAAKLWHNNFTTIDQQVRSCPC